MLSFNIISVHGPNPQTQCPLFRLPPELRLEIYKAIAPSEIMIHVPVDVSEYRKRWFRDVKCIAKSCKRALQEMAALPPAIVLRIPSLSEAKIADLETVPRDLIPSIRTVVVRSPEWVPRPDRFQTSSDPAKLRLDVANRFFKECHSMRSLLIEVYAGIFVPLADVQLKQLGGLRVPPRVEVGIRTVGGPPDGRMQQGPSEDTIREVFSAIKCDETCTVTSEDWRPTSVHILGQ